MREVAEIETLWTCRVMRTTVESMEGAEDRKEALQAMMRTVLELMSQEGVIVGEDNE